MFAEAQPNPIMMQSVEGFAEVDEGGQRGDRVVSWRLGSWGAVWFVGGDGGWYEV